MRSMTGFGTGSAPLSRGRIVGEVRSVNHRFLDVQVRTSRYLMDLAGHAEHFVRERTLRGRFDVTLRSDGRASSPIALDIHRARSALRALVQLRDEVSPKKHWRGTVGIATAGRDTGGSQFFINLAPNLQLAGKYTLVAEVTSGMEIVDRLEVGDKILATRIY